MSSLGRYTCRVPGTNEASFIEKYDKLISAFTKEKKEIIIRTDQNLDYLKINHHSNTAKFLDTNLRKPQRLTFPQKLRFFLQKHGFIFAEIWVRSAET